MTTVYAVFESIHGESDRPATLAKLFTDRGAAERWAVIQEDQADTEHLMGRTSIRYSYVVEPWELHER